MWYKVSIFYISLQHITLSGNFYKQKIMKKVLNVGIGKSSFIIEEDAYQRLDLYLERFRNEMDSKDAGEVMEDVEQRIAELFYEYTKGKTEVVSLDVVERVICQLGYPGDSAAGGGEDEPVKKNKTAQRLFRVRTVRRSGRQATQKAV